MTFAGCVPTFAKLVAMNVASTIWSTARSVPGLVKDAQKNAGKWQLNGRLQGIEKLPVTGGFFVCFCLFLELLYNSVLPAKIIFYERWVYCFARIAVTFI